MFEGFVKLPGRGLITVTGEDRYTFLQALVSNDLGLLQTQTSLYACLLTPQGKFLFDFIIYRDGDRLLLDCEGGERAEALLKRLKMYKLRSKVEMTLAGDISVYVSAQGTYPDPRHPALGCRSLQKPDNLTEHPFSTWDEYRIRLGVPDGSRDMVPEQSSLIECNIDRLNGISFTKGCYIGQELTARMQHRGLAKKHLYPTEWETAPPASGTDIQVDGKLAGTARSSSGQVAFILLKDDIINNLQDRNFKIIDTGSFDE
jgi:folate-binding protein YgfZ